MKPKVTFIGKSEVLEGEIKNLEFLGWVLAFGGLQVQTSDKGPANQAVTRGVVEQGTMPILLAGKDLLSAQADSVIVYADDGLLELLDNHHPNKGWREDNATLLITNNDELWAYLEASLLDIKQRQQAA